MAVGQDTLARPSGGALYRMNERVCVFPVFFMFFSKLYQFQHNIINARPNKRKVWFIFLLKMPSIVTDVANFIVETCISADIMTMTVSWSVRWTKTRLSLPRLPRRWLDSTKCSSKKIDNSWFFEKFYLRTEGRIGWRQVYLWCPFFCFVFFCDARHHGNLPVPSF